MFYLLYVCRKWQSDLDRSQKSGNRPSLKSSINPGGRMSSSHRVAASSNRPALRRSVSQKDLRHNDGYSVSIVWFSCSNYCFIGIVYG